MRTSTVFLRLTSKLVEGSKLSALISTTSTTRTNDYFNKYYKFASNPNPLSEKHSLGTYLFGLGVEGIVLGNEAS